MAVATIRSRREAPKVVARVFPGWRGNMGVEHIQIKDSVVYLVAETT